VLTVHEFTFIRLRELALSHTVLVPCECVEILNTAKIAGVATTYGRSAFRGVSYGRSINLFDSEFSAECDLVLPLGLQYPIFSLRPSSRGLRFLQHAQ
jgi:hypothetical protein